MPNEYIRGNKVTREFKFKNANIKLIDLVIPKGSQLINIKHTDFHGVTVVTLMVIKPKENQYNCKRILQFNDIVILSKEYFKKLFSLSMRLLLKEEQSEIDNYINRKN